MKTFLVSVLALVFLSACEKKAAPPVNALVVRKTAMLPVKSTLQKSSIREVPVLCYHNFSPYANTDMTVSYQRFEDHIRSLADSGYQSILPGQLLYNLEYGEPLPPNPVIISFDDGRLAQYTMAADVLEQYGFKGVFFILTVTVDKPNYMSCTMLNDLATRGHAIGAHTYDHQAVSQIHGAQWITQLEEPKIFLENAIHEQVNCFAYPFGPWTEQCIEKLEADGYKMAFQLEGKPSPEYPLFTLRRLLVNGHWTAATLHQKMKATFNRPRAALL